MPHRHLLLLAATLALAAACDKGASESASAAASQGVSAAPVPSPSAAPAPTPSATPSAAAPKAPPDRVAAQHVLVAYKGAKGAGKNVTRSKAEAKELAADIAKKARAGEDFSELAKKHSDDPGSRDRLGSVGTFTRDKMVKEFSDAAFALEVDGISDPVETPYGFHVIKRNQ